VSVRDTVWNSAAGRLGGCVAGEEGSPNLKSLKPATEQVSKKGSVGTVWFPFRHRGAVLLPGHDVRCRTKLCCHRATGHTCLRDPHSSRVSAVNIETTRDVPTERDEQPLIRQRSSRWRAERKVPSTALTCSGPASITNRLIFCDEEHRPRATTCIFTRLARRTALLASADHESPETSGQPR